MLLTVQDLAIIALIITAIIVVILYKLLYKKNNNMVVDSESKKKTKNSRIIRYLEEQDFTFIHNIDELHLNFWVDDKETHIVSGRNIALLKKDHKKYLLKVKTANMEGKRYNSPDIRTPILEIQSSMDVDGVVLFDKEKDKYQVYTFKKTTKLKYLYLLLLFMTIMIVVMFVIILKKSGVL